MFVIEQIGPLPIYHVTSRNRKLLSLAFMRMQEYYESPKFRGKLFSINEYKTWYIAKYGSFSYVDDWHGFNVPSEAVFTVLRHFADHTTEETLLFDALKRYRVLDIERFYLIATSGSVWETLHHEVCHALYYLIPSYRIAAKSVLQKYKLKSLRAYLRDQGYDDSVIDDEIQAYSMSHLPEGAPRTREFKLFRREIKQTLAPYLNEYMHATR